MTLIFDAHMRHSVSIRFLSVPRLYWPSILYVAFYTFLAPLMQVVVHNSSNPKGLLDICQNFTNYFSFWETAPNKVWMQKQNFRDMAKLNIIFQNKNDQIILSENNGICLKQQSINFCFKKYIYMKFVDTQWSPFFWQFFPTPFLLNVIGIQHNPNVK